MVSTNYFSTLALSFPEAVELPHFERTSFRVHKKIFATHDIQKQRAMLKLPLKEQSVFCAFDREIVYPVPGAWGKKGATYFELGKMRKSMLRDAMAVAYCGVAPKALASRVQAEGQA